jgi:glycosyltransferase involved in cell wall biosynthesis
MMKVLHILASFQHPTMRGSARHYYFLRDLARRHKITLLALSRTSITPEARKEINDYVEGRLSVFEAKRPGMSHTSNGKGLVGSWGQKAQWRWVVHQTVRQMREKFRVLAGTMNYDVVLFHGKDVFPVIDHWAGLPLVVDFCDATSTRIRQSLQYARALELPRIFLRYVRQRRADQILLDKTRHVAFISARDRDLVAGPDSPARIIPNGVDLAYWTRRVAYPDNRCIVFTGVMDYTPNADAAMYLIQRILPQVRASLPNLKVFIAGRDPLPDLVDASRRYSDITVTGTVTDIRPYLEQATVFVAPLRIASGTQNKVLEAMAMGLPVLTTPVVAAGLRVGDSGEPPVRVAAGADALAEGLIDLFHNPTERSWLATKGRRFVQEHFDWKRSSEALEDMCLEATLEARSEHSKSSQSGRVYSACDSPEELIYREHLDTPGKTH